MRAVLNISLPRTMVDDVKDYVAEGQYSTVSEFFRHLLRDWQEDKLVRELNKSREEIKAGKGIYLKSLKDLR